MDLVHRGALEPDRIALLSARDEAAIAGWTVETLGPGPHDSKLLAQALTHPSHAGENYQRLEFLGDRVLGLVCAEWLFELFPAEPEGALSRRFNALVSGETCAEIAREIGLPPLLILGKQARDDGAQQSDHVLGDVVEALIGVLFLGGGIEAARAFIRRAWGDRASGQRTAPRHPKSALQEWAAAHNCRPPAYALVDRSGPQHAPVFRVEVTLHARGRATGEGSSKQEAETAAARALLDALP